MSNRDKTVSMSMKGERRQLRQSKFCEQNDAAQVNTLSTDVRLNGNGASRWVRSCCVMWKVVSFDAHGTRSRSRIDALAMAVAYWTKWLGRDVSREEGRRLEELMEQEYRKFEGAVLEHSIPH